jgi:hypothetical protein
MSEMLTFKDSIAVIATFVSIMTVLINWSITRKGKQADTQIAMHQRFDALQVVRADLLSRRQSKGFKGNAAYQIEVSLFFDRFWSLQFDQFNAWRQGHIPDDIYKGWMYARCAQSQKCRSRNPPRHWNFGHTDVYRSMLFAIVTWAKPDGERRRSVRDVDDFLLLLTACAFAPDFEKVELLMDDLRADASWWIPDWSRSDLKWKAVNELKVELKGAAENDKGFQEIRASEAGYRINQLSAT